MKAQATVVQMPEVCEALHQRRGTGADHRPRRHRRRHHGEVLEHAHNHHAGFLGFWSLGCDNGSCPGQEETLSGCSRLDQQPYQFTELFANQN